MSTFYISFAETLPSFPLLLEVKAAVRTSGYAKVTKANGMTYITAFFLLQSQPKKPNTMLAVGLSISEKLLLTLLSW